jgi:hypothetical protein
MRWHAQGRILWTMGGAKRDDPKEARTHFEIASCEECDSQARAPNSARDLGSAQRHAACSLTLSPGCASKGACDSHQHHTSTISRACRLVRRSASWPLAACGQVVWAACPATQSSRGPDLAKLVPQAAGRGARRRWRRPRGWATGTARWRRTTARRATATRRCWRPTRATRSSVRAGPDPSPTLPACPRCAAPRRRRVAGERWVRLAVQTARA